MRKFALLTTFIIVFSITQGQTRKEIWSKDIDYLKTELSSRHKNLFFLTSRDVFYNRLDSLKNLIDSKTDAELAIALQIVVAQMGDDHTSVDFNKKAIEKGKIPLFTYWYSDGLYVIQTTSQYRDCIGSKLLAINQIPIDTVISRVVALNSSVNPALIKYRVPFYINIVGILEYFNICSSDSINCSFISNSNEKFDMWIKAYSNTTPIEELNFIPIRMNSNSENVENIFKQKILSDGKTLFVQYNLCWGKEMESKLHLKENKRKYPSFNKFKKEIIKQLNQPNIERLVFDLRYNPGGSSKQGTELIQEIAKIDKINKKGNLFVLVGRKTFSSAIINTMDFKNNTNAIIVGEPTSGKPNHYGETKSFLLPNCGLKVTYSTNYFKYSDKDENTVTPDIIVDINYDNYSKDIDSAIEWIQNYK